MKKQDTRMSLREGSAFLDGEEVLDCIKLSAVFTPDVGESKSIGQRGKSRRWLGYDITGSITQYRSTPWLKIAIKRYLETGETPVLTIVGKREDKASDFFKNNGAEVVTLQTVVLTGDISLIELDSEGEFVEDTIDFGAESMI